MGSSSFDDTGTSEVIYGVISLVRDHQLLEMRPPQYSDESLALKFSSSYANELRFVATWGRWLYWDGVCWRVDEKLDVRNRVRKLCRQAAAACSEPRIARGIASAKTVSAVESLARVDPRQSATVDQWDADPWLLNTPAGIVDLRSGKLRPAQPTDYMMKCTATAPGGDCPRWKQFLARVTGGDGELANFLQRILGYALTGSTQEHALFFFYGTGANGKSVLLSTVSGIAANYHVTAAIEAFTASTGERHPTDLAGLKGARIVTATETEEGRRWAEAKIKAITGGDKIAARFMRQDFFQFEPQFKLLVAGNHKPGLRGVDEAIRRRLHLLPFAITIPPEERDLGLIEKLRAEWPGILAWMIEGCLTWQRLGLDPPEAVILATRAYLEAEDAIAAWIEEKCEQDAQNWETSSALFMSWSAWAQQSGEPTGSLKRFVQTLEARGYPPQRHRQGRGFLGLRIRMGTY